MEMQTLHEAVWQTVYVDSKRTFNVPKSMKFIKKVRSSVSGTVASFSQVDGSNVAVEKITDAFQDIHDAKCLVQNIRLMRKFEHPNLLAIQDMYLPENSSFDDIYLVCELMDADLHRVIYSKQQLTEHHHQYLCCQILCGLRYLHGANVVHYDLQPRNLLVNKNCDLKISDFSKARGVGPNTVDNDSTYVVHRWYWAPEVMLMKEACHTSIDIWSVGCILCELIGRKPVFMGKDCLDQVKKILAIVGSPSEADLDWLPLKCPARSFMTRIGNLQKQPWPEVYPQVSTSAHETLEAMLAFHPHHRIDAAAALQLPYFEIVYEQSHIVVNCHESDSKHVRCTTLGGDLIGTFSVPEGEQIFDGWLAKKVAEAKSPMVGTLSMVNPAGEVFCSRHFEEDSEPIEDPVDWISDTPCLTKCLLQAEVYRECWKFRPWIADRDKQLLHELGIALPGSEQG